MKITIDLVKLFKRMSLVLVSLAISCSLVFMLISGIRILSASPSCMGDVCFTSSLDDPLLGWAALLIPAGFILASIAVHYIYRD